MRERTPSPVSPAARTRSPEPAALRRRAGGPVPGEVQVMPTDQPPEGAATPDARPRLSFAVPPARGKAPRHLADLDLTGRRTALAEAGLPPFRADQLSRHYFTRFTRDAAEMTDLPAGAREQLAAELLPELITEARVMRADGGRTLKHLWELHDGVRVESVLMRYRDRTTLCVSSQAGCGMACPFCATGQMGLTRNLTTAEIVEQVRRAARASADGALAGGPARLSNVVFMGMGEPMINYRNVVAALHRLVNPPRRASACPPAASPSPPSASCRSSASWQGRGCPSHSPCPSTPPTTNCGTPSSRSTPSGGSASSSTPPTTTSASPAGACPSSTPSSRT
ncbi:dual-specificity RNA methyltransferase RlmN [Actinomyces denticolens]|nr:dual-specificity RNA methyltransferase RlmN [Actinomyces denticolens]